MEPLTTDHDALLQQIIATPDDDAPRLIYADWLDEHGQPERAEFIRVQVNLARSADDDPQRPEWQAREQALLEQYACQWALQLVY